MKNSIQDFVKDFDIIHTICLDELASSPSSTLYRKLIPHFKNKYEPHERFVFTNKAKIDLALLTHVANTLDYIDISSFFCLIITNQTDTKEFFTSLNQDYTVIVADLDYDIQNNHKQPMFLNSVMCAHAWSGVHLDPNGSARICCDYNGTIKQHNGEPYNIKDFDLKDIITSDYMNAIRDQFRKGIVPDGCTRCFTREKNGSESKRQLAPFKLDNIYGYINWESDECDNPLFLGGHLGNLCNLKCRICSPAYSSQIASEDYKNSDDKNLIQTILVEHNWNKKQKSFWDDVKSNQDIVNFEFLGGEPLMLKDNLEFLDYLINSGHSKNCNFEFVSNGTQFSETLANAHKFRRFTLTLSIDNIGKRFEYERNNAVWTEVNKNIDKFLDLANTYSSVNIGVSITVSVLNVYYLPDVIDWLDSKNFPNYYLNSLYYPKSLSLNSLTDQAKCMVLDRLENASLHGTHRKKINSIIDQIKQSETSNGVDFCEYIRQKDVIRDQDFSITHPEIASAMGYSRDIK